MHDYGHSQCSVSANKCNWTVRGIPYDSKGCKWIPETGLRDTHTHLKLHTAIKDTKMVSFFLIYKAAYCLYKNLGVSVHSCPGSLNQFLTTKNLQK